uniref:ASCH domain-containing protein n=1 Tax=Musa acuminata subsp. malaccensis TaxID=214687 RepID=A0A804IE70_MUSAM
MEGGGTVVAPPETTGSPPSPGVPPIDLSDDHMEELLRFTLSLAASPTADDPHLALSLSPDYCSRLLQPEPSPLSPLPLDGSENTCGGAPPYPLYKRLARAIRRCIHSRSFSRSAGSVVASIPLDESVKMKESDWDALILDKGSELLSMFNAVDFELHVQEPFFSQLRACLKTVEGRCAVGNYNRMVPGSLILFNKCLLLEVQHVNRYSSFSEMLQAETLAKVLPGVATIDDGVQIYRKFYTEEKEMSNGVLAISVSKPTTQPYDSLAKLLSVEGCSLTDAARALSKHVNRSSSGWWGVLSGSESNKNRLALEAVNHLLNNCCWMNVHLIQPHGPVFEIRVPEGFGARWSKDGLKFIGFLEPYTEEGFSKGWKH